MFATDGEHTFLEASWKVFSLAFLTPLVFHHLLIAVVLIIDIAFTKGYRSISNTKETKKEFYIGLLISLIIPLCWLIPSIVLISQQIIVPQYPFMYLFSEVLGNDGSIVSVDTMTIVFS